VYRSYSKRAAALQSAALAAWRDAVAAAREMRSELRALIMRARQRRLRAAIEKCALLPPLHLQRSRWVEREGQYGGKAMGPDVMCMMTIAVVDVKATTSKRSQR
jgi:hypothetical protein